MGDTFEEFEAKRKAEERGLTLRDARAGQTSIFDFGGALDDGNQR